LRDGTGGEPLADPDHGDGPRPAAPPSAGTGRGDRPNPDDRIGDGHVAGDPAEQRGAEGDDDREAVHQHQQQPAGEDHQGNRDRQADDQQDDVALGRRRHGDDVVEAHHQVGDQDRLDRRRHAAGGGPLSSPSSSGISSWTAIHSSSPAPTSLRYGQAQQLDGDDRQHDPHHHRGAAAPGDGALLLIDRQAPGGECDHHGVVAREDDVHADDLHQRDPEFGAGEIHAVLLGVVRAPARSSPAALVLRPTAGPSSAGPSPKDCGSP
jgi:hypothetical protein